MPSSLDVRAVHGVDAYLTNMARLYRPLDEGFVADEVCPRLPVAKESDLYPVWDRGPFFGAGDDVDYDLLGDRTPVRRVDFTYSREGYLAEERALGFDISPRERSNADSILNLETNKQRGTMGRLALLRERRIATLLQASGVAGGELDAASTAAATAKWDAAATTYQSIFGDVIAGKTRIRQQIGVNANIIIIPAAVAEGMHRSQFYSAAAGPQIVYMGSTSASPAYRDYPLLPPVLWGMRVLVAGAVRDTAADGGTFTASEVWGEAVRLLYVTPGPAIETPSVAYTFQAQPAVTRRWRDNDPELDVFKVSNGVIDEKVVAPLAGYTITDCLT
jgi:hypothetical protein